jgi:methylmalonyl-CoA mutase, C-terminal domain
MTLRLNSRLGRVGLGMLGLDVHTKGLRTLSHRLTELGCDVAYFGEHLTVEALVRQAKERDVDLIGISFSSGAYVEHCRDVIAEMRSQGVALPLMIGGLIHQDDHPALKEMGVEGIFGPGSQIEDIIDFIEEVTVARVTGKAIGAQDAGDAE